MIPESSPRMPCTCSPIVRRCPACVAYAIAHHQPGISRVGRPASRTVSVLASHHAAVMRAVQRGEPYATIAARYGITARAVTSYLHVRGLFRHRKNPRVVREGGPRRD